MTLVLILCQEDVGRFPCRDGTCVQSKKVVLMEREDRMVVARSWEMWWDWDNVSQRIQNFSKTSSRDLLYTTVTIVNNKALSTETVSYLE